MYILDSRLSRSNMGLLSPCVTATFLSVIFLFVGKGQTYLSPNNDFGGVNLDLWDDIVSRHVKPGALLGITLNVVDYSSIADDPIFDEFLRSLGDATFANLTRNESFALGINAYNAFSVSTLIQNSCNYEDQENHKGECLGPAYGLPDITFNDMSTAFTKKFHRFGGELFSLKDIASMMHPSPSLPLFNEPLDNLEDLRIFGALAACSISGPNLAMEAYFPDTIDQQINQAVSSWMSNPWKGLYISKSSYTVYFTEIMKWFKDDFDQQGGVVKAYYDHFPQDAKDFFDTTEEYQIRYIDYIWDANGPVSCSCMPSVTFSSIYGAKCHVV